MTATNPTDSEISLRAWLRATRRSGKGGCRRDLGVDPLDLSIARGLLASCLGALRRCRSNHRPPQPELLLSSRRALFNIATLCGRPKEAFTLQDIALSQKREVASC